jgi:hypothetical protein
MCEGVWLHETMKGHSEKRNWVNLSRARSQFECRRNHHVYLNDAKNES